MTLAAFLALNGFIGPVVEELTSAATCCRGWNGWAAGHRW